MCLVMAIKVIEPLECLNRALQTKSATISGMLKAANHVKDQLLNLRTVDKFRKIMNEVEDKIEYLELSCLKSPRRKTTPKRFTGPADAYNSPVTNLLNELAIIRLKTRKAFHTFLQAAGRASQQACIT